MTPSIDIRIATIVRAMEDVVAPAIDPGNSLAREQAALVVGQVRLIAAQWSRSEDYARVCLADLAGVMADLAPAGGPLTRAAQGGVATALAAEGRAEAHYKQLMVAADALVRAADADGEPAFRADLRTRLLDFSARQSMRDRSWFAGSGFDLNPDQLQPIDDLVAGAAR